MKDFPIPVVADLSLVGPGTQAADDDFSYMPIPRDVPTFSMPQVPEDADSGAMRRAAQLVETFVRAMGSQPQVDLDLADFDAAALQVLNESLGEGEVSVRIGGAAFESRDVRIQETVFAGVWRERHFDGAGELRQDWLRACALPPIVVATAERVAGANLEPNISVPPGAMNAPALLTEIRDQVRQFRPGRPAHVINLTLLPMAPADHDLLTAAVPVGNVAILSRGFGNCRVTSTGVRHLWRVQYFNSMQTLILNTLEIVGVPEVALAAPEDLADSRERLIELIEWMQESAAA